MANISAAEFQFISPSEFRILDRKFSEYTNTNDIGFDEFKEILTSNGRIIKEILSPFLDRIKKKVANTDSEHLCKQIFNKISKIFNIFSYFLNFFI